ncbi:hypothetical protein RAS1_31410 [Phycisphaerae bacterium RAS1]|nr:hypothetical protein RAS1_31410 [Phycisphaerae bacterium RAS1]
MLFKLSGGPLVASARVARVREYHALSPARVATLQRTYGARVCAPAQYWRQRRRCRYAVVLWLEDVARLTAATATPRVPRQFGTAWIACSAP